MDQFRVIFFAGLLVFVIAGTYVIWGPSQKSKRKSKVPGLQNLGNSCFVNAVMQALAVCPAFINYLQTILSSQKVLDVNEDSLISKLLKILLDLNSNAGICSAAEFLNVLRLRRWVISNEEQDAHEFFHVLTTTLEEETSDPRSVLSLLEIAKLENTTGFTEIPQKVFIRSSKRKFVKSNHPFRGLLANQLVCKQCNHRYPIKYDTFDSISLNIPSPFWGQLTLQDCIQKFVSCEQIKDVTCEMCNKMPNSIQEQDAPIKLKSTFTKQSSFGKLPDCLCFHIPRTIWSSSGMSRKCYDYLMFPEVLSMDSFVYRSPSKKHAEIQNSKLLGGRSESFQPNDSVSETSSEVKSQITSKKLYLTLLTESGLPVGDHVYLLKAVIVHIGDLLSGHFVTYRRGAINTNMECKWFCTSDLSTREVPFSEVKQVCAYMLFYEKINVR